MPGIVALPRPLSLSARLQLAPLIPTPRLPLRSGREGRGLPGRSRGLEPQAGPPSTRLPGGHSEPSLTPAGSLPCPAGAWGGSGQDASSSPLLEKVNLSSSSALLKAPSKSNYSKCGVCVS